MYFGAFFSFGWSQIFGRLPYLPCAKVVSTTNGIRAELPCSTQRGEPGNVHLMAYHVQHCALTMNMSSDLPCFGIMVSTMDGIHAEWQCFMQPSPMNGILVELPFLTKKYISAESRHGSLKNATVASREGHDDSHVQRTRTNTGHDDNEVDCSHTICYYCSQQLLTAYLDVQEECQGLESHVMSQGSYIEALKAST